MRLPVTISEAARDLRSGVYSSRELTHAMLARADALDDVLGVYISRCDEAAICAAEASDRERARGIDRGPLHGIPIGLKDNITTCGTRTTVNSVVADPYASRRGNAKVVERILAAGAVIMGKTSLMEFAIGLPDPSKPFPIPRNPWDITTWPGGSSSGSAAGIPAQFFLASVGSDTGGSLRCPASFTGISTLKPTYGAVPTAGTVPLAFSLDTVGPMARDIDGCAALQSAIADHASRVPPSRPEVSAKRKATISHLSGLRIGFDRTPHEMLPDLDPAVSVHFDEAIDALREAGADLVEIRIPYYRELSDAALLTLRCEAFAYHRGRLQERWGDYGGPARTLIADGAFIGGADYHQAQRVRRVGRDALLSMFEHVHALVTPTTACAAPSLATLDVSIFDWVLTPIWNAVGFPAASVPMGFNHYHLPLGLQIIAPPDSDSLVLRIGREYQRITPWHLKNPSL